MAVNYVVNVPLTDVWSNPWSGEEKERLTQALLGDLLVATNENGSWVLGQVADGYQGYVKRQDLVPVWASLPAARGTVIKREAEILLVGLPQLPPLKAYLGTRLQVDKGEEQQYLRSGYTQVCLPSGEIGHIAEDAIEPEEATKDKVDIVRKVLELALNLRGAPYLWGGITSVGIDCSGLVYVIYRSVGLLLPRDADQQYDYLQPVDGQLFPGDLAFFATGEPELASHVGLYLGQDRFIHASSRLGGVVVTSLNSPYYREHLLGWRRCIDTDAAGFKMPEGEV
ncbi:MAG TPA: C40 family peptidase [Firmicutes bacterium]|nr:C40 family peptidase [Bacillota bacterium]